MSITEHQHSFELFGTRVCLMVSAAMTTPLCARVSVARVEARLRAIHDTLTRFDPDSELSRLNARAGQRVSVSETLLGGIVAALRGAELSDGLVDPTLLPQLQRTGYATSMADATPVPLLDALAVAPPRCPARSRAGAAWRRIEVNERERAVRVPREVRLDLGGSGKGMAVDAAAELLAGAPAFAVDAGGDIRIGGTHAIPRTVEIEHPIGDRVAHQFTLAAGAVATSGLRTRIWRTAAGYRHHLLDPATGEPAWTGVIQATALAPNALEAETLAKTALLRGPLAGRATLERYGGALVLDSGEVILMGHGLDQEPAARTHQVSA